MKRETETDRILCFAEASGDLVRVEYPREENENPPEISRIEYSAFHDVREKRVPYEILAFRNSKVVATVKLLEFAFIALLLDGKQTICAAAISEVPAVLRGTGRKERRFVTV